MEIRSVGIDLGKTTFHLVALGDNGKVLLKKKFTQRQLIIFTANLQTTTKDSQLTIQNPCQAPGDPNPAPDKNNHVSHQFPSTSYN